jgi:cyclase
MTSIDRDGKMGGYDIELISSVTKSVSIPVIACGGAGKPEHMVEVVKKGKADAVAAASIFHFTQFTPKSIRDELSRAGIPVRVSS